MRKQRLGLVAFPVVIILGLGAMALRGLPTVMEWMSVDHLARTAHLIVLGEVVSVESRSDAPGTIYTLITVRVGKALSGTPGGREVTIRETGRLGDLVVWVLGGPKYQVGEKILTFLVASPEGQGQWTTLGLAQGKFTVERDEATGRTRLARDLSGIALIGKQGTFDHGQVEVYDYGPTRFGGSGTPRAELRAKLLDDRCPDCSDT